MVLPDPFSGVTEYSAFTTTYPVGKIAAIDTGKPVRISFEPQDYGKFTKGDVIRVSHLSMALGRNQFEEQTFQLGDADAAKFSFILQRGTERVDNMNELRGGFAELIGHVEEEEAPIVRKATVKKEEEEEPRGGTRK